MADVHGSPGSAPQMPANGPGPAPVPYQGPDLRPEPGVYGVDLGPSTEAGYVLHGVTNLGTTQDPSAHDVNAGPPDAPYYPGPLHPVNAMGDNDAGGRDDVAATIEGAVANATARWHEFQSGTFGMGSTYGDLMNFPMSGEDPGAGVGNTRPAEGFYDPPRDYGGTKGAPGYQGEAQ